MRIRRKLFAVGSAAALTAGIATVGARYEAWSEARDRERFPPPGKLIDVGGYRLHLTDAGAGGPTVVLDAGLAGFSLDWAIVLPRIAAFTRVCAYDRAGYGWSDPGPLPRTSGQLAQELHTLLTRAAIPGPYVLVGHSFAGYTLRIFANRYPELVAGLVLIDASSEDLLYRLPPQQVQQLLALDHFIKRLLRAMIVLARLGLVRLADTRGVLSILGPFAKLPPRKREMAFTLRYAPSFYRTSYAEYRDFPTSGEQARATGSLGAKPVTALCAIGRDHATPPSQKGSERLAAMNDLLETMAAVGAELQKELVVRLSTQNRYRVTRESGHQIAITQPDLVVEAIRRVVLAARFTSHQQTHRPIGQ